MKRIAIYGKGGIGKSTTVSNMSAALAGKGYTVMQIGCDPKADSTISLRQGRNLTPVLDTYRDKIKDIQLEDMYTIGYNGVICVELVVQLQALAALDEALLRRWICSSKRISKKCSIPMSSSTMCLET